jgi:hypothetical protein
MMEDGRGCGRGPCDDQISTGDEKVAKSLELTKRGGGLLLGTAMMGNDGVEVMMLAAGA